MPSGVTQHLQGDRVRNPQASVVDQTARGAAFKVRRDLEVTDTKLANFVLIDDFPGASDQAKVQNAVDSVLAQSSPPTLILPRRYTLTESIILDREIDTTDGLLRFFGIGPHAGFHTANEIALFDSSLDYVGGEQPPSEFIAFNGIRFSGETEGLDAFAFTGKFFRMDFFDCEFWRIGCLDSATFAQEWSFERCMARLWTGTFFNSEGAYYVNSHGSKYQFASIHSGSGDVFSLGDATAASGVCGCSFVQDIAESNNGTFVSANQAMGLAVCPDYLENVGRLLDLRGAGANEGVKVMANFVDTKDANKADANHYEIEWGTTTKGVSMVTHCTGKLHNVTGLAQGAVASINEHADLALSSDSRFPLELKAQQTLNNITANAAGTQAAATQLVAGINRVTTVASGTHACKLPQGYEGAECHIYNNVSQSFVLYPYPGDQLDFLSVDQATDHPGTSGSGAGVRSYKYAGGVWNWRT